MNKKRSLYLFCVMVIGIFFFIKHPKHSPTEIDLPVNFPYHLLEPVVSVEIEKTRYNFLVDLGSVSYPFHLEDRILQKIKNKENLNEGQFGDLKGNCYAAPEFRVAEIKLGSETILNSIVTKRNHQFLYNSHIWTKPNIPQLVENKIARIDGKIGLPFFQQFNCLFDFPNSVIILRKNTENPEKIYSPDKFVRIPFSIENYGIVLSIETDAGIHRMVLDTGATFSVINKKLINHKDAKEIEEGSQKWYYPTNKLIINECNYGSWELVLFDILEKRNVDGCLGADFFLEYAIYLDFHNKIAYIQRPEKSALSTQWKRLKLRTTQLYNKLVKHEYRFIQ